MQTGRAGADRQPRAAQILGLDRQEPLGDGDGIAGGLSSEELGGQALGEQLAHLASQAVWIRRLTSTRLEEPKSKEEAHVQEERRQASSSQKT